MGVAQMTNYPQVNSGVSGTLVVKYDAKTSSVSINGVVTGLTGTGGWHVHTGFSCEDATLVGGHYLAPDGSDPWEGLAYSVTGGSAAISATISGFSLTDSNPVLGRAIVFHNAAGARRGCGIIAPSNGEYAMLNTYPGYPGTNTVRGVVVVTSESAGGARFRGTLSGLTPNGVGGWHVHSGHTCALATAVGGHYYDPVATPLDPWNVPNGGPTYQANALGVAVIDYSIDGFSITRTLPVAGRALVVHDPEAQNSARSGCGVISIGALSAIVHLSNYPGLLLPGATLGGSLLLDSSASGLHVNGVLSGLNGSTTGGWHIHSGFACDLPTATVPNPVAGHFYPAGEPDAWLATKYSANSRGVARLAATIPGFGVTEGPMAVLGRAVVVHNSRGDRVACGVIKPAYGHAVHVGQYPDSNGDPIVGVVLISATSGSAPRVMAQGTLAELPGSSEGGWHIHTGTTCADKNGVKGHYFAAVRAIPLRTSSSPAVHPLTFKQLARSLGISWITTRAVRSIAIGLIWCPTPV